MRAGSKELRVLQRRLLPGYSLVPDGKSKATLLGPDGEPVRYPDGRHVGIPNSPSHSTLLDVEKRLRRLGVIR
jgi:hypothetical protein